MKERIVVMGTIEATKRSMPYFNAYTACGTGAWKTAKHPNRAARKANLRKELRCY